MKLRIQDQALRLRLRPSEVETLRNHGKASGSMPLPYPRGAFFRYVLSRGDCDAIEVAMQNDSLVIRVPEQWVKAWADSEEVSIHAFIACENGHELEVLIEKDFKCLIPREGEDSEDQFPNPAAL